MLAALARLIMQYTRSCAYIVDAYSPQQHEDYAQRQECHASNDSNCADLNQNPTFIQQCRSNRVRREKTSKTAISAAQTEHIAVEAIFLPCESHLALDDLDPLSSARFARPEVIHRPKIWP